MTFPSTSAQDRAPHAPTREPQPGDILLFFRAHRGRDYLIKWVTHSRYYHAGIYAGDNHLIESRPQGVVCNDLRGREGGYIPIAAPDGMGEKALAWAKTQIGAGYDRTDMLVIFLEHIFTHWHINYNPRGKYTCGEFVAIAFQKAGVTLIPGRALEDVVPGDFERLLPSNTLS